MNLRCTLWAALVTATALQVDAIVLRHDAKDADALALGQRFDAVGRVIPDGGATLIAPRWALTAAHVAASMRPGDEIQFGGRNYAVKRTLLHPDADPQPGRPPEVDLALVELEQAVTEIEPVALYRATDELGKQLFIVGYGDYGPAGGKLSRGDGVRRAVTNVVDDAGPLRIFLGFDPSPNGTELEGVGGPGDSGGPALLEADGELFVAGVSSASMNGKPGQYGVIDVYTRVSSHAAWIDEMLTQR